MNENENTKLKCLVVRDIDGTIYENIKIVIDIEKEQTGKTINKSDVVRDALLDYAEKCQNQKNKIV